MPPSAVVDTMGAIGGGVLAACLAPQLWKLYKTRSARDLSYMFLSLYVTGLVLTLVYLYYEDALVAWVCVAVEIGFGCTMVAAKYYLDNWGPLSWRAAKKARPQARLTNSPSLASEIRIDVQDFAAGGAAPFPLLRPQPSHAAQHLLLDARLALLPASAAAAPTAGGGKQAGGGSGGSEGSAGELDSAKASDAGHPGSGGGGGPQVVLSTVAEMLEASLAAAGLPVQRRQFGAFPSFRRRPSQAALAGGGGGEAAAAGDGTAAAAASLGLSERGDEEGEAPAPDMLFFTCRDGFATAIFYRDTATLSVDLLGASDACVQRLGDAAAQLCEALVAEWPGTRIAGSTLARLPRA